MLAIAADGNRVLTERLDRFVRADGSEVAAGKVMGIFEVEGVHIVAWRDYFDVNFATRLSDCITVLTVRNDRLIATQQELCAADQHLTSQGPQSFAVPCGQVRLERAPRADEDDAGNARRSLLPQR